VEKGMKLAPGTPLAVGLLTDQNAPARSVGRLVMATGLAQLEWSAGVIAEGLTISPLRYLAEPGLHPARSRTFDGLHGFLSDCLPDAWAWQNTYAMCLQGRGYVLEQTVSSAPAS
jgi:serine/threonine-protein kinase HipA